MSPGISLQKQAIGAAKASAPARGRFILCCFFIAGITFITFLPALQCGFTNWDDNTHVTENTAIRGFSLHHLAQISTSSIGYYQPLTMLSYMTEYSLFHLNPVAFHCTNILLHCINCLLVFALLYGLSGNLITGMLAALLFAVHPLRVESVAWIAERKGLLSSLFYFLSLLCYWRYLQKGGRRRYLFCLLSLVLSLLAKPMAVSQPFILLLLDYVRHQKVNVKMVIGKIPFFMVAAVFVLAAIVTQRGYGAIAEFDSLRMHICTPFYGILFYLLKSIVPLRLSAFYPMPTKPDGLMLASPILVLAGVAAFWWKLRHRKIAMFGVLFFLITLLPVLQIVPIGSFIVAERYTYLPIVGIDFVAAGGIVHLFTKQFGENAVMKMILIGGVVGILAVFAGGAFQRCEVWKDSITLWNDVIQKSPCAIAYLNRGSAYAAASDYDRAIDDFNQTLRLRPGYADGYYNRGLVYSARGDNDRAIEDYSKAIAFNPAMAKAYNDRGVAFTTVHDLDRAEQDYNQAIQLDPGAAESHYNLGLLFADRKEYDSALGEYNRAILLNPAISEAYNDRALIYCVQGDYGRAIEDLCRVIAHDPGRATAYCNRGHAYAAMGDVHSAMN
ncbi:MAG: tetratricopeptide repeat protein, partial [Chitinispirillaceae bacterium]